MPFSCINCKKEIDREYKACPHCGEPITDFLRTYLDKPIDEKYEILSRLGIGGMGEVYKVLHTHLHAVRVVKLMRPSIAADAEAHERFLREARLATKIQHPNVATLHDFSTLPDGSKYMVWEYIDGTSLAEVIRTRGALSPRYATKLSIQALLGLDAIHRAGIVHRDVSPDNIMITREEDGDERVKIIDLGIAKGGDTTDQQTATGMFVGKWRYCSPEHLGLLPAGERIDGRADIYSFGIVMYEMLTGEPPFIADGPQQYILQHAKETPKPLRVVNPLFGEAPRLEAMIFQALEKDRNKRFQTARDFARELEKIVPDLDDTVISRTRRTAATIRTALPQVSAPPPRTERIAPPARTQRETPLPVSATVRTDRSITRSAGEPFQPGGGVLTPPVEDPVKRSRSNALTVGVLTFALIVAIAAIAILVLKGPGSEQVDRSATEPTTGQVSPAAPTSAATGSVASAAPTSSIVVEGQSPLISATSVTTSPETQTTTSPSTTTTITSPSAQAKKPERRTVPVGRPSQPPPQVAETPQEPTTPPAQMSESPTSTQPASGSRRPVLGRFGRGSRRFGDSPEAAAGPRAIIPDYDALVRGDAVNWSWVAPGARLAKHKISVGNFRNLTKVTNPQMLAFFNETLQSQLNEATEESAGTLTAQGAIIWAEEARDKKRGVGIEMVFRDATGKVVAALRHVQRENSPADAAEEVVDAVTEFVEEN